MAVPAAPAGNRSSCFLASLLQVGIPLIRHRSRTRVIGFHFPHRWPCPALPRAHWHSTTGSVKVASAARPGADSHHPKSYHLDLQGRSSSFAGCESQFSLNVNNENKKRAILFSFGACNRLSWGRRVGFFAKGAALMTFGENLLRASCCVRLIPRLCESTALRIEREEGRPRHPSGVKKRLEKPDCTSMLLPEPEASATVSLGAGASAWHCTEATESLEKCPRWREF